ncbi:hypothetical protein PBAL39_15974 [Pedobacter sp. BAL39]|nr:hypothetical protein PBAL39_15974 [Pedobacter sp. BAL39]
MEKLYLPIQQIWRIDIVKERSFVNHPQQILWIGIGTESDFREKIRKPC